MCTRVQLHVTHGDKRKPGGHGRGADDLGAGGVGGGDRKPNTGFLGENCGRDEAFMSDATLFT